MNASSYCLAITVPSRDKYPYSQQTPLHLLQTQQVGTRLRIRLKIDWILQKFCIICLCCMQYVCLSIVHEAKSMLLLFLAAEPQKQTMFLRIRQLRFPSALKCNLNQKSTMKWALQLSGRLKQSKSNNVFCLFLDDSYFLGSLLNLLQIALGLSLYYLLLFKSLLNILFLTARSILIRLGILSVILCMLEQVNFEEAPDIFGSTLLFSRILLWRKSILSYPYISIPSKVLKSVLAQSSYVLQAVITFLLQSSLIDQKCQNFQLPFIMLSQDGRNLFSQMPIFCSFESSKSKEHYRYQQPSQQISYFPTKFLFIKEFNIYLLKNVYLISFTFNPLTNITPRYESLILADSQPKRESLSLKTRIFNEFLSITKESCFKIKKASSTSNQALLRNLLLLFMFSPLINFFFYKIIKDPTSQTYQIRKLGVILRERSHQNFCQPYNLLHQLSPIGSHQMMLPNQRQHKLVYSSYSWQAGQIQAKQARRAKKMLSKCIRSQFAPYLINLIKYNQDIKKSTIVLLSLKTKGLKQLQAITKIVCNPAQRISVLCLFAKKCIYLNFYLIILLSTLLLLSLFCVLFIEVLLPLSPMFEIQ